GPPPPPPPPPPPAPPTPVADVDPRAAADAEVEAAAATALPDIPPATVVPPPAALTAFADPISPPATVEPIAADPVTVSAPPPPRRRRPLPSPDELIAQVRAEPSWYLLEHENPNGTLRANGKHGWYYPTRYGGIRAVVLHSLPGGDTADALAAHLASIDQPEAAHAAVDPDVIVDLLPDDATALHGVRSSSAAIDLALVYPPSRWGSDPAAEEALLVRAATWTGVRAVRHSIPVRRISVEEWHTGRSGIAANGDVDPGPDFPWDRFLQLTAWVAGRVAADAMSSR
ncbi:MAG TPA: hypothetical protein VF244_10380, partial [Acidimicrobiales bacterium]